MGGILSYPETRPRDSGLFDFLVDLFGGSILDLVLELILELLTCILEA